MKTNEIRIRDPFILTDDKARNYYLFGTTDDTCWKGKGIGFNCYRSSDLLEWEGPFEAFRSTPDFWGTKNFWAPEVHKYKEYYYMFATFKSKTRLRGTQILKSSQIEGPYEPITDGPVTPAKWECLDGTLYIDENGNPWIIFCHEWLQIHDGAIYTTRLRSDLTAIIDTPVFLFNASDASWAVPIKGRLKKYPCYVTDGPFIYQTKNNKLLMLWSSFGKQGYTMGFAISASGRITGPWEQVEEPLWSKDGGHGMIFRTFDNKLFLTFHTPNKSPNERPYFHEIREEEDFLVLVE